MGMFENDLALMQSKKFLDWNTFKRFQERFPLHKLTKKFQTEIVMKHFWDFKYAKSKKYYLSLINFSSK